MAIASRGVEFVGADFIEFKYKLLPLTEKPIAITTGISTAATGCKLLGPQHLIRAVEQSNPKYQHIILVQFLPYSASIPATASLLVSKIQSNLFWLWLARQS